MTCQHCGAPPNNFIREDDGRLKCARCAHIQGTPLPCADCGCRTPCTGHSRLTKAGANRAAKLTLCAACGYEKERTG